MRTTIELGKVDGYGIGRKNCLVTLELKINPAQMIGCGWTVDLRPIPEDAVEVSIVGNVWNHMGTDIISCGQNTEIIRDLFSGDKRVQRICSLWDRYHLNGMKCGTRRQNKYLDAHRAEYESLASEKGRNYYGAACELLSSANLLVNRGYRYGSAWLYEPIPVRKLAEIKRLFGVKD
jgi:hypothetical protein